ncbi:MAG: glycosyltransferase family 1 protein [Erysipelotrichaceae bacterium]
MDNMNQPIRIAQMMTEMNYGGVEMVVMNYYRHINHSKVQFDFFVLEGSIIPQREEIESLGGRIYVVPHYKKLLSYEKAVIALLKENKYKIVHSHMNSLSVFSLRAAKKAGVPIRIAHNHSTSGKGEYKKNILKYALRPFAKVYPNHLAACSHLAGDWLYGKNANYIVFNNAIDLDKYSYNENMRNILRKELRLENRLTIGHIGRFCYQKNHEYLIEIFKCIKQINKDAVLLLIGDGENFDKIKLQIKQLDLDKSVILMGSINEAYKYYNAMDAFVLPSRYEGLPVVGVEAQASDLQCFFSDEITSEAKILDKTTYLSLSKSPNEWAETICDKCKYVERNDNSSIMSEAGFNIKLASKNLEDYYYELLEKEGGIL